MHLLDFSRLSFDGYTKANPHWRNTDLGSPPGFDYNEGVEDEEERQTTSPGFDYNEGVEDEEERQTTSQASNLDKGGEDKTKKAVPKSSLKCKHDIGPNVRQTRSKQELNGNELSWPLYDKPRSDFANNTIYSIDGLFAATSRDVKQQQVGVRGLYTANPIKMGEFIGFYGDVFLNRKLADNVISSTCPLYSYTLDFKHNDVDVTAIPLSHLGETGGTVMGYANELPEFPQFEGETLTANVPTNNMFMEKVCIPFTFGEPNTAPLNALGMFALRDIKADEELFWWYGPAYNRSWSPQNKKGNSSGMIDRRRFKQVDLASRAAEFFLSRANTVGDTDKLPVFTSGRILSSTQTLREKLTSTYTVRLKDGSVRPMEQKDLCHQTMRHL